jgi:SRSO17 transposase
MSRRLPVEAAPGALESFAQAFDELLERRNQRELFRRYLEGLLLPSERNKTLTGLANTEPVTGAQKAAAQKLQWFLSESSWDPDVVNERRLQLLMAHPTLKPHAQGALVIDETGDRKWGTKTAFVGRQYLGSIGKIDNGVVSVQALWADEQRYYPLVFEPFTPAGWFTGGKNDPEYRTKPQLALRLVQHAQAREVPFEAVVADSLYGEHREFKKTLSEQGILFVVMLKPSIGITFVARSVALRILLKPRLGSRIRLAHGSRSRGRTVMVVKRAGGCLKPTKVRFAPSANDAW